LEFVVILGLDGLRAIAILMVFFYHGGQLKGGWLGVQFFFVISGFLITDILLRMKDQFPKRDYFIKFYGRRFLRIFPLYYFYLFVMMGITAWLISVDFKPKIMQTFWDQLPVAATYTYDFFHACSYFRLSNFLTHFWSLAVEEQFYLVWPLVILLTPKKWLKQVFLTAILLGPGFRIFLAMLYRVHPLPLINDMPLAIYTLPFSHVDAFGFGAYVSRFDFPKPKLQLLALLVIVPVLGFTSQWMFAGSLGSWTTFGYPLPLENGLKQIWGYSLLNYFFAMLVYCVVREKLLVKILEFAPLRYLGKISYGMYVYHYGILWFAKIGMSVSQSSKALWQATWIALGATVVVSSLSYYLLEKPVMDLKDRFFSTRAGRA
jgi:peptidoglycan/LPS O-acetylase OafA/YrhL